MEVICIFSPQEIPYQAGISSGMKAGRAFHFKGVLPEDSYRYAFMPLTTENKMKHNMSCSEKYGIPWANTESQY